MNKITFGKDRYHQHPEMEQWCFENFGAGTWTHNTPKTWEGMPDTAWTIHMSSGYATFNFKNPKHLTHFILRWS